MRLMPWIDCECGYVYLQSLDDGAGAWPEYSASIPYRNEWYHRSSIGDMTGPGMGINA